MGDGHRRRDRDVQQISKETERSRRGSVSTSGGGASADAGQLERLSRRRCVHVRGQARGLRTLSNANAYSSIVLGSSAANLGIFEVSRMPQRRKVGQLPC